MKVYEFGEKTNPSILLIPGCCCHWKRLFGEVIKLLKKDYYVHVVSFTGFDETQDSIYISLNDEVKRIEKYVQEKLFGSVDLVYGTGLGGTVVGMLIQHQKIKIKDAIISGAKVKQNSDKLSKLKTNIFLLTHYKILSTGNLPKILKFIYEKKKNPYLEKVHELYNIENGGLPFIKRESIYNMYCSDLLNPLGVELYVENTNLHIFYYVKSGKRFLKRFLFHFFKPDIRYFNLHKEELLLVTPDKWLEEIKSIINH